MNKQLLDKLSKLDKVTNQYCNMWLDYSKPINPNIIVTFKDVIRMMQIFNQEYCTFTSKFSKELDEPTKLSLKEVEKTIDKMEDKIALEIKYWN